MCLKVSKYQKRETGQSEWLFLIFHLFLWLFFFFMGLLINVQCTFQRCQTSQKTLCVATHCRRSSSFFFFKEELWIVKKECGKKFKKSVFLIDAGDDNSISAHNQMPKSLRSGKLFREVSSTACFSFPSLSIFFSFTTWLFGEEQQQFYVNFFFFFLTIRTSLRSAEIINLFRGRKFFFFFSGG